MSESLCLGRDRLGASGTVYFPSFFFFFFFERYCVYLHSGDSGFLASVSVLSIKRARQMAYIQLAEWRGVTKSDRITKRCNPEEKYNIFFSYLFIQDESGEDISRTI